MTLKALCNSLSCLSLSLLISACCSNPNNEGPPEQRCSANSSPNSEVVVGNSCKVLVQMKDICTYDQEGRLKDFSSEPDGACLCLGGSF